MGIYSPLEVYPSIFDEIDLSSCETCTFDCDIKGYCKEMIQNEFQSKH